MSNTMSNPVASYVGMYTPFFNELLKEYGFTFSMAEAMNGIKHISDPLDVEDVLYTMQGALCHTKEECDVFEAVFCTIRVYRLYQKRLRSRTKALPRF